MTRSRIRNYGVMTAAGIAAIALVGQHEGLRTRAYKDVIGVPTICFGETRGVKMGDVKTKAECDWMLGNRLVEFEANTLLNKQCVHDHQRIPDKSYIQFLSLAYNIGERGFCRSSVVKYLNANNLRGACEAMGRFVYAGGVKWSGLVRRRAEEVKACLEGASH
jgi:lysozyme